MKPALRLVLIAVITLAAASATAAQESWVGKTIITKKGGIKIGKTDDSGKQVHVGELKNIDYKVLGDKDGWLQVNDRHGNTGWFDKADAVLLEDPVGFYTERIRLNGKDVDAYRRRALAWRLKGEPDIAMKDYGDALRLGPHAAIYDARAGVYADKGEYEKALEDYNEAIRLAPDTSYFYHNRGTVRSAKKDYDRAIADFNEAIRLDPKFIAPFEARGGAWLAKKEFEKAIADFSEMMRLDPENARGYWQRAYASQTAKDFEKAVSDYDQARRLDPKSFGINGGFARLLATCPDAKVRDGKRAVGLAKEAMELSKTKLAFSWSQAVLAAAYAECGDFAEAVRWQEKAMESPQLKNDENARRRLELYRDKKPYREE